MGPPDGLPRAVDALRAVHRSAGRPLEVPRARPSSTRSPLRAEFVATLDLAFETYARWIPAMEAHFRAQIPEDRRKTPTPSTARSIRAKALDTLRGLLPAATTSNVGLFGTGQALRGAAAAHVRAPAREVARLRAADADRAAQGHPGVSRARRSAGPRRRWIEYLADTRRGVRGGGARRSSARDAAEPRAEVTLTDFDPDGEIEGGRRGALRRLGAARRSAARDRATDVGRRARGAAARLRRRAREPAPQAGPRLRAHAATASTSSPTTARSAICSATGC